MLQLMLVDDEIHFRIRYSTLTQHHGRLLFCIMFRFGIRFQKVDITSYDTACLDWHSVDNTSMKVNLKH